MSLQNRIDQLLIWDAEYANDNTSVTNAKYDKFRDETRKLAPNHEYFKRVGGPVTSAWPKHVHEVPMGSLDKVTNETEFLAWYRKTVKRGQLVLWSDKGDGISISLRYVNGDPIHAVTRGEDGVEGEDITPNVLKMEGVPKQAGNFTGYTRGEILLRKSVFEKHFRSEGYKNCRNAAGGAAKDLKGSKCHLLSVKCYEMLPDEGALDSKIDEYIKLQDLGFQLLEHGLVDSENDILTVYHDYIAERRDELDYVIDGLVLQINDNFVRESLGGDKLPEGARAFKFPADEDETVLRDVVWQVGASGQITPVAYFDAVELSGASVAQANLHNCNIIRDAVRKGTSARDFFAEGDIILVSRRGDVIPCTEALITPAPAGAKLFTPPAECPSCGSATEMRGAFLVCPNKEGCEAQTQGLINSYLDKIKVKEFGPALVEALCEAGAVKEPADLYKLELDYVAGLYLSGKKFGRSNTTTALNNLHAKKNLPLHVLVGSLGIRLWGRDMCKMIVDAGYDTLDRMNQARVLDLIAVRGVEETKAFAFVSGFAGVYGKITNLLAAGVTIAAESTGSLKGSTFCFTGVRKPALEVAIEAAGGVVKGSASKNLTYLVAKDPNGASLKLDAARANGTKVISVAELEALLGQ